MGSATFIPLILSDFLVPYRDLQLPFGHGAFLIADSMGKGTYYEYGPFGDPQDKFRLTNNVSGNIRSMPLETILRFDSAGKVPNCALQSALDEIFHSSGMYESDIGVIIGAPFNISEDQYDAVIDFVAARRIAIDNGQSYSIFTDDGLRFVYNGAMAAGSVVIPSRYYPGHAIPLYGADGLFHRANNAFEYFGPNSWDEDGQSSNILPLRSDHRLAS
jgi:hypothetical protein